jgi:hypothetical protein
MNNLKENTNNKKILHHEALKSLCALQYYMSTLENQSDDVKKINYGLSFKLMTNIVMTLYKTIENPVDQLEYPPELMMIFNNLNNINTKLNFINQM